MKTEHKDTETLDRLYLEWSQFTTARNQRELEHASNWRAVLRMLREKHPNSNVTLWVEGYVAGTQATGEDGKALLLFCPWCKDTDFDLFGLKFHIVNGHCAAFNELNVQV